MFSFFSKSCCVATPLWDKREGEAHTPTSGKLESPGTPKNLELEFRGQNTSHWGVLYIIEKVLKCRCPKWPRMSHLDICNPSYGQKKGQESNTTKSRESTSSWRLHQKCDMALESSWRELQLWFNPRPDPSLGREVMNAQSPESPNRDNFGTPLWESREKEAFGCSLRAELQRILKGGRWWLPPSPGRGESSKSKLPVACPNTQRMQDQLTK
jgi:hypothetical protein